MYIFAEAYFEIGIPIIEEGFGKLDALFSRSREMRRNLTIFILKPRKRNFDWLIIGMKIESHGTQ
jgi:hypothetical protein